MSENAITPKNTGLRTKDGKPDVRDIDGVLLCVGDIVEITAERIATFGNRGWGANQEGERLRIREIYHYEVTGEWVGDLYYVDGSGSIFHSMLELYRKVVMSDTRAPQNGGGE